MMQIKNTDGRYYVDKSGAVYSKANYHLGDRCKLKKLSSCKLKSGYSYVTICLKDGTRKKKSVHRIVAEAYISNPENKEFVNHKNGVKTDNRVENLEWATRSENEKHAYRTGLKKSSDYHKRRASEANSNENNHSAKLNKKQVFEILKMIKEKSTTQREIAKKYNVSYSTITAIKKGRAWRNI